MNAIAAMLVTQHLNDLLREAEEERRNALVRGARRSGWSAALGRIAGLPRRVAGAGRRSAPRPAGANSASA